MASNRSTNLPNAKSVPRSERETKRKNERSPCTTCRGTGSVVLFQLPSTCHTCMGDRFVEMRPVATRSSAGASSNVKDLLEGAP